MARIPLDETPIFTQLTREYAAREAYERFFDLSEPVAYNILVIKPDVE